MAETLLLERLEVEYGNREGRVVLTIKAEGASLVLELDKTTWSPAKALCLVEAAADLVAGGCKPEPAAQFGFLKVEVPE